MTATSFLDGRVTLHGGDCLDILKTLPNASVDSVVTDPPYHLTSIVKRFGGANAAPARAKQTGAFTRASRGFMGKTWDGGDIAFRPELWAEVLRVLKPGGHLAAFSGTRTYHRMAVAIEDAGFEIRDQPKFDHDGDAERIAFLASLNSEQLAQFAKLFGEDNTLGQLAWVYGSGFPKSHDVSKAIDKAAGAQREVVGRYSSPEGTSGRSDGSGVQCMAGKGIGGLNAITAPATTAARQWHGWGSALKPAWEPICLARKPLDGTIAENVLAHGVGALNIDGCRIETADDLNGGRYSNNKQGQDGSTYGSGINLRSKESYIQPSGRFPANLIHDGSPEVLAAFPDAPGQQREVNDTFAPKTGTAVYGDYGPRPTVLPRDNGGSAARFFYTAKADADDRIGSKHPTVKPVDLMQWLVRLITPKGGVVLDPFAGTGTTGEAAWREGCSAVLIEREAEYQTDIARRMDLAQSGPDERRRRMAALKPVTDAGPLFGGEAA